jgi:hypothetical protein
LGGSVLRPWRWGRSNLISGRLGPGLGKRRALRALPGLESEIRQSQKAYCEALDWRTW